MSDQFIPNEDTGDTGDIEAFDNECEVFDKVFDYDITEVEGAEYDWNENDLDTEILNYD